jgi:hypothetical protein
MNIDPTFIDGISKLGALGFAVIAIAALVTRQIHTKGEFMDSRAFDDARLAEMRADRDEWRAIAKSSLNKLDRLTDVLEAFTGTKLPE